MNTELHHRAVEESTTGLDVESSVIATRRLLESITAKGISDDNSSIDRNEDRQLRLLLSQLESLKVNDGIKKSESSVETSEIRSCGASEEEEERQTADKMVAGAEEIVKELKKVQRQNTVTHRLLSSLIILTVAWQFSEVSLILKLKNGLSHPIKSLAGLITGGLKVPAINGHDKVKQNGKEAPALPILRLSDPS